MPQASSALLRDGAALAALAERKRRYWNEHAERLARLVLDILKPWHGLQKRFKGKVELAMTVPLNDVMGQLANWCIRGSSAPPRWSG